MNTVCTLDNAPMNIYYIPPSFFMWNCLRWLPGRDLKDSLEKGIVYLKGILLAKQKIHKMN